MPGHFEEIGPLAWVGNKNPPEKVTSVRCYVFRKRKRSGDNVFIQKVDVVPFRIRWIVVEREITCQHSVLARV